MLAAEKLKKVKTRNQVPNSLISEIENLMKQAGFDKNVKEDLQKFSQIVGGAENGISDTKIKWVLDNQLIPREDFLYALATIMVNIRGNHNYKKNVIDNPIKYELERLLYLCNYSASSGDIFPVSEKFRKFDSVESELYLSSIPNIFWDLEFPFEEIIRYYYENIKFSEQTITLDNYSSLIFGAYDYEKDGFSESFHPVNCIEGRHTCPDILRFQLYNDDEQLKFKSIDVIRNHNNARILMVLVNGNWIELTNASTIFMGQTYQDLNVNNYYNFANLHRPDDYFLNIPAYMRKTWKSPNIENLYDNLAFNPDYKEAHKMLTLKR